MRRALLEGFGVPFPNVPMIDHPIPRSGAQNGSVPGDRADALVVGLIVSPHRFEGGRIVDMEATG